jgi:hypothetical protein
MDDTLTMGRLSTPIPKLMRTNPRDHRGFAVPYIALIDRSGRPQFTINDSRKTEEARRKRLCSLCGKRLPRSVWFIGGSRCFMHPHGGFVDGPVHEECGAYAIRVCPFLAAPSYGKRIDDRLLAADAHPEGMGLATIPHMLPDRPERFGFGETSDYEAFFAAHQGWLYRAHTWDYVSWWRNGVEVNAPEVIPEDKPWSPGHRIR